MPILFLLRLLDGGARGLGDEFRLELGFSLYLLCKDGPEQLCRRFEKPGFRGIYGFLEIYPESRLAICVKTVHSPPPFSRRPHLSHRSHVIEN